MDEDFDKLYHWDSVYVVSVSWLRIAHTRDCTFGGRHS